MSISPFTNLNQAVNLSSQINYKASQGHQNPSIEYFTPISTTSLIKYMDPQAKIILNYKAK